MPSSRLALLLFALAAAPSVACARVRSFQADTVTPAPGGAWIAGTEGMAAFSDGTSVTRHDYPRTPDAPEWAYNPFSIPAARVVVAGGDVVLFTRFGEIFRWTNIAWVPVAFRFTWAPGDTPIQLDAALAAPDGAFLVQVHSDRLFWSSPGAAWREEKAPGYHDWLGFEGGALYGIGFQGGYDRALFRRAARERWDLVAVLGRDVGELHGMIRIPEGPLAVVSTRGLHVIEEGRPPRFVPIEDLASGRHPTARAAILTVAAGGELAAAPRPSPPAPAATAVSPPPEPRPAAQVATDTPTPRAPPTPPNWVNSVLEAPGHGPLLAIGGRGEGVLEITAREVRQMPCAAAQAFVGAIATPLGLRMVTRKAALVAVSPGTPCTLVAPAAIRDDEGR